MALRRILTSLCTLGRQWSILEGVGFAIVTLFGFFNTANSTDYIILQSFLQIDQLLGLIGLELNL